MLGYPHLPAALHRLTGDALHFWGSPAWRERLLRDIQLASGPTDRARALHVVDDAVTQGLAAFGFPRAPVRSLRLVIPRLQDELGTKYASCDLEIGLPAMRRELSPGGSPDGIVETWIHESVHGRHFPWGPGIRAEGRFPGYEEGLAEGITRLVSRQVGFVPGLQGYGRYVQTYEVLARVIGVTSEALYRGLYRLPNGSVMDGFVSTIDTVRGAAGAPTLLPAQRARLDGVAHRLFARAHFRDPSSARLHNSIRQAWRRALR